MCTGQWFFRYAFSIIKAKVNWCVVYYSATHLTLVILPDGVVVAHQTLTLMAQVQVLLWKLCIFAHNKIEYGRCENRRRIIRRYNHSAVTAPVLMVTCRIQLIKVLLKPIAVEMIYTCNRATNVVDNQFGVTPTTDTLNRGSIIVWDYI